MRAAGSGAMLGKEPGQVGTLAAYTGVVVNAAMLQTPDNAGETCKNGRIPPGFPRRVHGDCIATAMHYSMHGARGGSGCRVGEGCR